MPAKKPKPYVAKVALEITSPEDRYNRNGIQLRLHARGKGTSVPIAIGRAIELAFEDPSIKGKEPTYIRITVKVLSRWVLDEPPDEIAYSGLSSF